MVKPGGTTARGYGAAHKKMRAAWLRKVDAGQVWCPRCRMWIAPTGRPCVRCGKPTREGGKAGGAFCGFDLGHVDGSRWQYQGAEHACCNRGTNERGRATSRARSSRPTVRADWERWVVSDAGSQDAEARPGGAVG